MAKNEVKGRFWAHRGVPETLARGSEAQQPSESPKRARHRVRGTQDPYAHVGLIPQP